MAWTFLVHLQATLGGSLWSQQQHSEPGVHQASPRMGITSFHTPTSSSPAAHLRFNSNTLDGAANTKLCLALHDVFIALLLVLLILLTIFGNVLVVLSVFVYKRMRTFTNILLTSLATADLLVGMIVMPLSLLDLLHSHRWPFGRFLCSVWATTDVLLCTASILNLCVISLDRYMAITSPLKYPRTRSRKMAAALLSSVWLLSLVVCSPPWFVPDWNLFTHDGHVKKKAAANSTQPVDDTFVCAYSTSPAYRIYSALGSFYLPLLVMLSVYFKIFRVASEREALMRQSVGTCRLSNRIVKTQAKNQRNNPRCASAPIARNRLNQANNIPARPTYSMRPGDLRHQTIHRMDSHLDSTECEDGSPQAIHDSTERSMISNGPISPLRRRLDEIERTSSRAGDSANIGNGDNEHGSSRHNTMERECHSLADLAEKSLVSPRRKNTEVRTDVGGRHSNKTKTRLQPANLMAKAHEHYQTCGPGKAVRGSKEKMVYLRERKALKTIGIVVLGFIICWMPFFVLYLMEVFLDRLQTNLMFRVLAEFFLWLGYSNSVLNPIIYTMYNGDFRRCFRDLLSFGCIQHHRRTMSVKKLHQQSTIF